MRIQLPKPHPTQQRIKDAAARFNVVASGRRVGKTTLGINLVVQAALPGKPVAWFSPTYKMLAEVWRDLVNTLAPVTAARNVQQHRLELVTGGVVEMWSLDDADPARGRKYQRVVIDEAAMVPHLADAWQMAIRPTLTDYRGDAWFLSTPKGLNFFHALYQQGQDPEQPDWRSWSFPTSANPYISPDEIEAARAELPERAFAQEFLAHFLADGTGVFRKVLEAATAQPEPRQDKHQYVMGVDWGKLNDFTVLSVIDTTTRRQVALERFNQIDYHVQVPRLTEMYRAYKPSLIIAESNSMGEMLIEAMRRVKLPVYAWTATNASKAAVIEALQLGFERAELTILDDATQKAELLAYDAERLPSGLVRYGGPNGMHDDTVMALALAWSIARKPPRPPTGTYQIATRTRHT